MPVSQYLGPEFDPVFEKSGRLWQHLVAAQPGQAAALAMYLRQMPADWPQRFFRVGSHEQALRLKGQLKDEYDHEPEIAPYMDDEDCPACVEVEELCRYHLGWADAVRHGDVIEGVWQASHPDQPGPNRLYADVETAQELTADRYIETQHPDEVSVDLLSWVPAGDGFDLVDGGEPTGWSINPTPVQPEHASEVSR